MCEPVSIGIIAVGAGLSAYSAYESQKAANKAADFNAKMEEENAAIAEKAAVDASERGQKDKSNLRKKISSFKGEQRASFGASGVLVDSGSTGDITDDTQMLGDMDAFTMELNIAKEIEGFLREAKSRRKQASFIKKQKKDPTQQGLMSLLGSGSQAGATYYANKGAKNWSSSGNSYGMSKPHLSYNENWL